MAALTSKVTRCSKIYEGNRKTGGQCAEGYLNDLLEKKHLTEGPDLWNGTYDTHI